MKLNNKTFIFIALGLAALYGPKISGMSPELELDQDLLAAIQSGDAEQFNVLVQANPYLIGNKKSANAYLYCAVQQAQNFFDTAANTVAAEHAIEIENAAKRCLGSALWLVSYCADRHSLSAEHQNLLNIGIDLAFREAIKDADAETVALLAEQHHDFMQNQNRVQTYLDGAHAVAQSISDALKSSEPLPKTTKELFDAHYNARKIIDLFEITQHRIRGSLCELEGSVSLASDEPASKPGSRQASAQPTPVRPFPPAPFLPMPIAGIVESHAEQKFDAQTLTPLRAAQMHPEQNTSSSCPCTTCVIL
jgi:hypothetical protein